MFCCKATIHVHVLFIMLAPYPRMADHTQHSNAFMQYFHKPIQNHRNIIFGFRCFAYSLVRLLGLSAEHL